MAPGTDLTVVSFSSEATTADNMVAENLLQVSNSADTGIGIQGGNSVTLISDDPASPELTVEPVLLELLATEFDGEQGSITRPASFDDSTEIALLTTVGEPPVRPENQGILIEGDVTAE